MRKTTKRNLAVAGVTVLLLGGAGAAFAYWTAGGAGTGTATTTNNAPIVAVQTSVVTGMQPGDSAQTLSGNFNNANTSPVYVATVTAAISSVTLANGVTGTCDASDYTLAGAVMTVGAQVAPGNGTGAWTGATIKFNNKPAVNQDACKGATVNLAYTIG